MFLPYIGTIRHTCQFWILSGAFNVDPFFFTFHIDWHARIPVLDTVLLLYFLSYAVAPFIEVCFLSFFFSASIRCFSLFASASAVSFLLGTYLFATSRNSSSLLSTSSFSFFSASTLLTLSFLLFSNVSWPLLCSTTSDCCLFFLANSLSLIVSFPL